MRLFGLGRRQAAVDLSAVEKEMERLKNIPEMPVRRPPVPGTIDAEIIELREGQEALANWMSQIAKGRVASQPAQTVATPVPPIAPRKRPVGRGGVRFALAGLALLGLVAVFSVLPSLQFGQPGVQAAMVASLPTPAQPVQQQAQQQTTQVAVQTPPIAVVARPSAPANENLIDRQRRHAMIVEQCGSYPTSDPMWEQFSDMQFQEMLATLCGGRQRQESRQDNAVVAHYPMQQPFSVVPPRQVYPPVVHDRPVPVPPVVIYGGIDRQTPVHGQGNRERLRTDCTEHGPGFHWDKGAGTCVRVMQIRGASNYRYDGPQKCGPQTVGQHAWDQEASPGREIDRKVGFTCKKLR